MSNLGAWVLWSFGRKMQIKQTQADQTFPVLPGHPSDCDGCRLSQWVPPDPWPKGTPEFVKLNRKIEVRSCRDDQGHQFWQYF